jgi:hypothetical protein
MICNDKKIEAALAKSLGRFALIILVFMRQNARLIDRMTALQGIERFCYDGCRPLELAFVPRCIGNLKTCLAASLASASFIVMPAAM